MYTNPKTGKQYKQHDHCAEYQECRFCGIHVGVGVDTPYDLKYFADDWNPEQCPKCEKDDAMWLPVR